jgi:hypothetical protein
MTVIKQNKIKNRLCQKTHNWRKVEMNEFINNFLKEKRLKVIFQGQESNCDFKEKN